jgi:hypothetical protein
MSKNLIRAARFRPLSSVKAIIEDVKKFNPRCSFPTIIIGETVVVGYKEKEIKEALGME